MLLDRGLLRSEGSGPELTGSDLPLPESVQSIIAARLDALPSDEKLLLQDAAVVGRAFWLGALAEVGQHQRWSVEHMLHELERKQLLRRESDSIVLWIPASTAGSWPDPDWICALYWLSFFVRAFT